MAQESIVEGQQGQRDGDSPQEAIDHYCFSVDLRSLKFSASQPPATVAHDGHYFLQYSYSYFGYSKKVTTSGHGLAVDDQQRTIVIRDGFFAFNFATTASQLQSTFSKVPLIIQLIEKGADGKSKLRGTCTIELSEFSDSNRLREDGSDQIIVSSKAPLFSVDEEQIAKLHIVMCLQNLGLVSTFSGLSNTLNQSSFVGPPVLDDADPIASQFESLLVEAAVEVELWKRDRVAQFNRQLESELQARAAEQEARLGHQSTDRELQLKKREAELRARVEQLDQEISSAIQDVRQTFEARLRGEQERCQKLETEKADLLQRLAAAASNHKPQSTSPVKSSLNGRHCCLDRTNSLPSSVRSASKQRSAGAANPLPRVASINNQARLCQRENSTQRTNGTTAATNGAAGGQRSQQPKQQQQNGTATNTAKRNGPALGIRSTAATTLPKREIIRELQREKNDVLRKKLMSESDPMIKKIDQQLKRFRV